MSFTLPTALCFIVGHNFVNTTKTQETINNVTKVVLEKIERRTCSRCGEKNPEYSEEKG